jgi:hypothetical protein
MAGLNKHLTHIVAKEEYKPYMTAKLKQRQPLEEGPIRLRADGKPDKRFRVNRIKPKRVNPKYFTTTEFQDFLLTSDLSFTSTEPLSAMTLGTSLKYIWAYAKKHNLVTQDAWTHMTLDAKLFRLFSITPGEGTEYLTMQTVTMHMRKHLVAVVPRAVPKPKTRVGLVAWWLTRFVFYNDL